jgi:hypothetical protein
VNTLFQNEVRNFHPSELAMARDVLLEILFSVLVFTDLSSRITLSDSAYTHKRGLLRLVLSKYISLASRGTTNVQHRTASCERQSTALVMCLRVLNTASRSPDCPPLDYNNFSVSTSSHD